MDSRAARPRQPLYQLTMVDRAWRLRCPNAALPQAFDSADAAFSYISRDSAHPATVEVMAGTLYMVKQIAPAR